MKKCVIPYLLGIMAVISLFSCAGNKSSHDSKATADTIPTFCAGDTADVIRITTQYLEHLKKKEFDEAMRMLYHIEGEHAYALTDQEKAELQKQYKLFPVLSYKINGYTFTDPYHTEINYTITFFERSGDNDIPNTMSFSLRPQRINAVWCLSLLNRSVN